MTKDVEARRLRIPGPTPVPPEVMKAIAEPVIGHRSGAMQDVLSDLRGQLRQVFQTDNEVVVLTSSGTGGMEAAVANLLSPGDRALVATVGVFGNRWADLGRAFGAEVDLLTFPHGEAIDADRVKDRIERGAPYRAVFVTHNETSTGVTNDLQSIGEALSTAKSDRPLLVVDAISSLGAIDLQTDAWSCDVVVTGSQKALMTPPGLALVSASDRALEVAASASSPRYYFDLRKAVERWSSGQTPYTPAVTLFRGLHVALHRLLDEGLTQCFARHATLAQYFREGAQELGLAFLAREEVRSNSVTAVLVPEETTADAILGGLRERFGIEIAGGQGPLKGQIFRIGHMGWVTQDDLDRVLLALRHVLGQA